MSYSSGCVLGATVAPGREVVDVKECLDGCENAKWGNKNKRKNSE